MNDQPKKDELNSKVDCQLNIIRDQISELEELDGVTRSRLGKVLTPPEDSDPCEGTENYKAYSSNDSAIVDELKIISRRLAYRLSERRDILSELEL